MHHFSHIEISTTDLARSRAFYEGLFRWSVEETMETYWMMRTGEEPGAGLNLVPQVPPAGATLAFVTVPSLDETLRRAGELGGVVVQERTEIGGGFGCYAHVREPGGAVIGVYQEAGPDAEG
jgi:predicted enzyme related to lactoylglutathione lyase